MSRYLLPHAAVVAFCCSFFSSDLNAQAVPVISATKKDTFTPNGVGKALPGTNITYTTVITNNGTANATGVTLADAVPNLTTLVPGSVHASPLAANDVYAAIGNTKLYVGTTAPLGEPHTTSATNLTTNDTMFTSPDTIVLTAFTGATTQGGSVTVNADGTFTYTPPVGFAGADTFTYTAKNSAVATLTDTAVVTINVSNVVWYVDSSLAAAGNGTSVTPFNALTVLNIAGGVGHVDNINQTIFLYDGTYTGGLTLEDGQALIGQQHGLNISSIDLVPAGGGVSKINGGLILANGNTIQGISLGDSAGFALSGGAVGTTVMNTLTAGNINNTTGGAVSIATSGALNMVFTTISSTNSAGAGILLVNCTGTFTGGGGAINTAAGADVNLNAGSLNFTYDGTITDDTGTLVFITGQTGGTKDFNGAITDGNDGDGGGISLTSNTGAIISFDGGVILSTGANNAFAATGGGTVTVTGSANTIVTTTGTALNVTSTTIGASGLTFQSISANGGANGIVLNTTGSSGGLTVAGTGTTDGSGGTIQNTTTRGASFISANSISLKNMNFTNAATADFPAAPTGLSTGNNTADNAAIHLQTVTGVVLDNLNINGSAEQGINGNNVTTFTLKDSVLTNLGGGPDEDGIHFFNMLGTCAIINTTITSSGDDNINIQSQSGTGAITITNGSANTGVLGSGYLFGVRGTSNMTIKLSGVTSNNNFSGGIVADCYDTAVMDLEVSTSSSTNNNDAISISSNNGNSKFNIHDNVSFAGTDFGIINVLKAAFSTGGVFEGKIANNPIVVANGKTADGISVQNLGAGTLKAAITGNSIDYAGTQRALYMAAGQDGNAALEVSVTGNTIDIKLDGTGNAVNAILAQAAVASPSGDPSSLCADIGGALALKNTITHSLGGTLAGGDIRIRQRFVSNVRLPGYAGGGTDAAAAATYLDGRNTIVSPSTVSIATSITGGAACMQPAVPLLAAQDNENQVSSSGSNSTPDETTCGCDASVRSSLNAQQQQQIFKQDVNVAGKHDKTLSLSDFSMENGATVPIHPGERSEYFSEERSELPSQMSHDVQSNGFADLGILSQAQLDSIVSVARKLWETSGLTEEQATRLYKANFEVTDLPGMHLGDTSGQTIRIDNDAGGNNWFIDPTPADDVEFSREAAVTRRTSLAEDPALNRVDLLTTLMHEMGHVLGLSDRYDMKDRDSVMFGMLSRGERRLPAKGEASGAQAFEDGKSRFMGADFVIGTLPAGKSVTIQATVLIDDPVPAGTTQVSSQGRVFGTNFTKVNGSPTDNIAVLNTNDPDTGGPAIDATITPVQGPPLVTNITSTTTNGSYTTGTVIPVTVTFDIAVNVIGTPQLTLETGATDRAVNYTSGSSTNTLTFNYTVQAGDTTADLDYTSTIALALNSGTIRNSDNQNAVLTLPALGAAGSLGINKNIVIDTTAPTVASVNSSTGDGSYKTGDSISIQVNFSEAVNVTGTPQLTLETGATDRVVNYASGSGSNTLTFTYTVQAGDTSTDLDYLSTTALALNSGTIRDAATNIATLTLAAPGTANSLGNNKAIVIDTTAPTVASVNSLVTNGSYNAGDILTVRVTFSEVVNVTGIPQLTLETGATDRVANYSSGSGTNTLTFNYTVQAGDTSADLDYQSTTALALNGGSIRDAATNNATLTLAAPGAANSLGANKAIVIDTTAPTVASVNSSTPDGTYKVGDPISVQVNFSEAVDVTGTPQLTLETGTTDRTANYVSGSGTSTLTFTYTVLAGDTSTDLDYQSTTALALNGGTIRDAPWNNATLTLASPGAANSLGNNKAIVIDGVAPTVTAVNSSTANGTYKAGDALSIQVNFSEAVTVTGTPQLTLETGTTDQVVNYASGSGTSTLTFSYTVQAGDTAADLDYTSTTALALNGGTIRDAVTNDATLTLASPGAANSLGANKNIVIDTTAPTVTSVSSSTANGTYKIGAPISIQVNFSEAVTVTGTPQLILETGTTDQVVNYASGSGTSALTFTYTVQAGDVSADLDYTSTTALALNGGTIRDAVTNDATLTLAAPGTPNSLSSNKAIVIDGVLPTVTNVTSSSADGVYLTGSLIPVTVTFSEPVIVIGTPQLTLETGTTDQVVNYASGSGTDTLTFTYTVQAGDLSGDLDYTSTTSLALNGGTIRDVATNNATLTLAAPGTAGSLGNNKAIVIGLGITPNTASLAQNATQLIISGAGFSPIPANNTVTLTSGTATVTGATSNQLTCTLDSQPSLGALNATVVVASVGTTGPTQVATIVAPPTVTPNTANLAINAATVTIGGTGFDAATPANNTVVFNNSAIGNVTAATATSLTVTFTTQPAAIGSLTAVVTSFGGSSGSAVQVATVAPVITANATNLSVDSNTITLNGFGFSPTAANNTVTFNNGAVGTVTSSSATTLDVTFSTHATTLGALSASVTVSAIGPVGPTQVATIIPGAATHFAVSAPGNATAGAPVNFTVTALDQFNNTATGYTGTAHFTSTDGAASLPADYTFVAGDNGVRLFTNGATLQTGGSQTIIATDTVTGSIIGTSANIAVGESVSIAATDNTAAVTGGDTGTYRFTRGGTGGSLVANFQLDPASTAVAAEFTLSGGSVTFTSGTGAGTVTFPNGSATVDITLTTTANATGIAKPNKTVQFNVAAGSGYNIGAPANATVTIAQNGFVVINTNDAGEGTLRQAVLNANAIAGTDTITFSDGTGGTVNFTDSTLDTIVLTSGEITITTSLNIPGTGASKLAVSGNNASRIFNVSSAAPDVSISGLTITNGFSSTNAGGLVLAGNLTRLEGLVIENCTATTNSGGFVANGRFLLMDNCFVRNNTASTGNGGGGNIQPLGSALIRGCTISGNTAALSSGGFFLTNGFVINSTISGNTANGAAADSGGGGVRIQASSPVSFISCTITGNNAPNAVSGARSGLWAETGTVRLSNSLIAGNSAQDIAKEAVANIINDGGNLIGENTSVTTEFPTGVLVGTDASPLNPLIAALADNGGPTPTHSFLPGSPAPNAGVSALVSEVQTLVTNGSPGGTYTLTFGGQTTASIGYNATSSAIQSALQSLSSVGAGNVIVTGNYPLYVVSFAGTLSNTNQAALAAAVAGGTTVAVTTHQEGGPIPYDQRGPGFPRVQGTTVDIGALEALLFTPTLTNATTNEDVQSTSGLVITANTADAGGTTHYKITNLVNGTLFKADGTTAITAGTFITKADGAAGLKFTPSANFFGVGSFDVQAALSNTDAALRDAVVPAIITVTAVADTPSVTNSSTTLNTPSTSGLVITRNPVDGAEVTHYKITVSGNLFQNDGVTSISTGTFITIGQGAAGLKFTPNTGFIGLVTFTLQASTSASDAGLGGAVVTATINVGTPEPTIPVAPATVTTRNLQNGLSELVVTVRNTTAFDINGFRLFVDYSAYLGGFPTLKLYNATSPSNVSPPYIDYPFPVESTKSVTLTLQFYTNNRVMPNPFVPVLTLQTLAASQAARLDDPGIQVTNIINRVDGSKLLEFNTVAGKWYRVSYSPDMSPNSWYYSPVPIKAGSNKTQWIDNGAPGTESHPNTVSSRFYRVSEIPAP